MEGWGSEPTRSHLSWGRGSEVCRGEELLAPSPSSSTTSNIDRVVPRAQRLVLSCCVAGLGLDAGDKVWMSEAGTEPGGWLTGDVEICERKSWTKVQMTASRQWKDQRTKRVVLEEYVGPDHSTVTTPPMILSLAI
ncbi:hypothetical protein B0H34DRAFT_671832 [Crassisporium funariophilum]|nr:hypothetical protein B0H34DRAFT_671832 [Crassisporium funariophilum]